MKNVWIVLGLFTLVLVTQKDARASVESLRSLLSGKPVSFKQVPQGIDGTVLVFLSASCPCSDAHLNILKSLSEQFPKVRFLGVHSNQDESLEAARAYFLSKKLPFSVLSDRDATLADQYRAYKTPHAFLVNREGKILYSGGVSASRHPDQSTDLPLEKALLDFKKGVKIQTPRARTLGCVISRKKG